MLANILERGLGWDVNARLHVRTCLTPRHIFPRRHQEQKNRLLNAKVWNRVMAVAITAMPCGRSQQFWNRFGIEMCMLNMRLQAAHAAGGDAMFEFACVMRKWFLYVFMIHPIYELLDHRFACTLMFSQCLILLDCCISYLCLCSYK